MRRLISVCLLILCSLPLSATEPNPSREQRALVEKLLQAMSAQDSLGKMIDAMFEQVEKQFMTSAEMEGDDTLEEARETFATFREHAAKIDFEGLLHESFVRMYAKYYTEPELRDLIAFYETPTGRKSIEIMPQLTAEAFQAGTELVSPKVEEAMKAALAEQEKKRPWRRTMADMRTIATVVEAYATDHNEYPAGDLDAIEPLVEPTYVRDLPKKDIWGHPYAYVVSGDRQHYRVVSAGADSVFDWDSRRIVTTREGEEPETRYRERLQDDIIFGDGSFIQAPIQSKPREEE